MTAPEVYAEIEETSTDVCTVWECRRKKGYLLSKRILDIVLSLMGLMISILPMAIICLLIKLESPGPARGVQ